MLHGKKSYFSSVSRMGENMAKKERSYSAVAKCTTQGRTSEQAVAAVAISNWEKKAAEPLRHDGNDSRKLVA